MHMGDVYSGASKVLAWLGKVDEDSTGITDKTLHSTRSSLPYLLIDGAGSAELQVPFKREGVDERKKRREDGIRVREGT